MYTTLFLAAALLNGCQAFVPHTRLPRPHSVSLKAVEITKGVQFDTVAREWRMKWSPDNDKASLAEVQAVVDETLAELKSLDGVKSVQRIVCGGCLDYKLITALDGDKYGAWEAAGHPPEAKFLKTVEAIDGITTVETQTFTIMPM